VESSGVFLRLFLEVFGGDIVWDGFGCIVVWGEVVWFVEWVV